LTKGNKKKEIKGKKSVVFLIGLLFFLRKNLTDFWNCKCFQNQIDAQKDTHQ
jgi:hypothetical protein